MDPIPQPTSSQYRHPQPDTNPNVRKDQATEKRKRVTPTKRFRDNTAVKPNETAAYYPPTIPKAPTNIKPQAQEGTPENRPPPLEDGPVCKSTPWPGAGKISGNLFEERKDWLLPPNYLDNNNRHDWCHQPKTSYKGGTQDWRTIIYQPQNRKVSMGTKLPLLQKSRKRRRRLEWQSPKTVAAANTTPTEDSDGPSKMPPDSKLPDTPELSETQPGDIQWSIPESVKNLQALGSRDGET